MVVEALLITLSYPRYSERLKYTIPVQVVKADNTLETGNHVPIEIIVGISRPGTPQYASVSNCE
jgi:hypothetical protein